MVLPTFKGWTEKGKVNPDLNVSTKIKDMCKRIYIIKRPNVQRTYLINKWWLSWHSCSGYLSITDSEHSFVKRRREAFISLITNKDEGERFLK